MSAAPFYSFTSPTLCEFAVIPCGSARSFSDKLILSFSNESRTICETMSRAFSCRRREQCARAWLVLVAPRHSSIRLHVLSSIFSPDVRQPEFPVLFRLVDAFEKALALLLLREVEVEFYDARSVAVQVPFQIHDRAIPVVPDAFRGAAHPAAPSLRRISGCTRTISTSS